MRKFSRISLVAIALALFALPAAAQAKDSDGDGMGDRWETRFGVASPSADPDRDRVDNRNEFVQASRPRDRDSNDDGQPDGREDRDRDRLRNAAEDATGMDPTDKDTDGDGVIDSREQAGVVSAYDEGTGELTIDLASGSSVTGVVTDATDVECLSEAAAEEEQDTEAGASLSPGGPGGPDGADQADRFDGFDGFDGFGGQGGMGEDGAGGPNRQGSCDDKGLEEECPAGTLAAGARVHEAELRTSSDGAEWIEIEILS